MRIESLLLVLVCLAPSLAIRGERRAVRVLRGDKENKGVFEGTGEKKDSSGGETARPKGEEKENIADKKDKETKDKKDKKEKDDKKDKKDKKCKKAMKGKKSKKDKGDNLVRRYAEVTQEEEMKFCLHSTELSEDKCDKVKKGTKLPTDGSVKGGLDIELVHSQEQSSDEILDSVNGILSSDTNPRFVGCESLEAPPAKKKPKMRHSRARRFLEEYVTVLQEEDTVDVTGVDFEDLNIVSGGCEGQDTLEDGMVCDKISSDVQIFYKTHQATVSDEDKEDMYNLLVETIYAQASVGSFGDLGNVASVQVRSSGDQTDTSDQGDQETSDRGAMGGTSDDSTFQDNKGPILGAAAAFAALFGAGYWYATGEDDPEEEKNNQTDESDSD